MRDDERYEIQRAFDQLPHIVGSSWAVIWFRMNEIKDPTRDEYREKVLEYFNMLKPITEMLPEGKNFEMIVKYIKRRNGEEIEKIKAGLNYDVELRYDRYVDYG